jgi:hypothetical protein
LRIIQFEKMTNPNEGLLRNYVLDSIRLTNLESGLFFWMVA